VGAVAVGVGRLRAVDPDGLVRVAAAKALLEDRAGQHVAQLGFDHRAGARKLDVLDADDGQQLAIHLEHHPVAKIVSRNHCLARNSKASSYPAKPSPVITPRAARAVTLRERNSSRAWMFERWTSTTGSASAWR